MSRAELCHALAAVPRVRLGALPTPLQPGPTLPGGSQLWIKRDDLTGLGMGGNKVRKLEHLCADARARCADTLVTVGAGQSNHARLTAAASSVLGLPAHLVLGGARPTQPAGNQLLSRLFGACLHFPGVDAWADLEKAMQALCEDLRSRGGDPYAMPIGGSTAVGVRGFIAAWIELMQQCTTHGLTPSAVIHASSSGGTHAGLLAGRAVDADEGRSVPDLVAVGVAKRPTDLVGTAVDLARDALGALGVTAEFGEDSAAVDGRWQGAGYAEPTPAADDAIRWAGRRGAQVLDRVYTGKAFACLLESAQQGRWAAGESVVFWHTGGQPALFAAGGHPQLEQCRRRDRIVTEGISV